MDVLRTILEVTVAALAVVGAYGILRELMLGAIASRQITVAVILSEAIDEVSLDILLDEAMRHPRRRRGQRTALVLSRHLLCGEMGEDGALFPPYASVVERYGAKVFIAEEIFLDNS